MQTIGLTGGIGSGKSTVAKMLGEAGFAVVDADATSRSLTQSGGAGMAAIELAFGAAVIAPDGSLNRDAMRQMMLTQPQVKVQLEGILHPLIAQLIDQQLSQAALAGAQTAVLDIPLLAEGGKRWRSRVDAVWVVDCLPTTQMERVRLRSGWPQAQTQAVMAAQASRAQRLACADAVIFNDGLSLEQLREQVMALVKFQISKPQILKPQNMGSAS